MLPFFKLIEKLSKQLIIYTKNSKNKTLTVRRKPRPPLYSCYVQTRKRKEELHAISGSILNPFDYGLRKKTSIISKVYYARRWENSSPLKRESHRINKPHKFRL